MFVSWLPLFAFIAYAVAAFVVTQRMYHPEGPRLKFVFSAATLAIVCQMLALSHSLFTQEGQNFSLMNVTSLVCWLITLSFTITALRTPLVLLLPIIYSFAAVVQLLVMLLPSGVQIHHFEQSPWLLTHILIAFITYVILIMATLYSFQVSFIRHKLKQKTPLNQGTVLPSLLQSEQLLYRLVLLGTALLGVTLLSGALFSERFFALQNLHKNILSLLAFVTYSVVMIGHWRAGWHGRLANTLLVSASLILTLAYFGSRFVREVLLNQ